MTATAPSGGTPESRPDTTGNTTAGTAEGTTSQPPAPAGAPPRAPAGASPPAAAPTPPSGPPDTGGGTGGEPREGFWSIVVEALGLAPGSSRRRQVVTLLVVAVMTFVAVFRDTLVEYFTIERNVVEENDSNKKYDASQPPFTVTVRPETSEPPEWAMVLDRTLTADEVRTMTSPDNPDVFSYLKSLGGRPLAYVPLLEHAPKRYTEEHASSGRMEFSDTVKMTVLSTRQYEVTVNDWKVTDLTCRRSTAKTVVARPSQGGVAYQGIRLHLPPRADEPVRTDDAENQGKPYFATDHIAVGGGQTSGALRAEVIAPPGQSCEWGLKLHYNDNYVPAGRWVQVKDDKGEPLRIRTESVPADPRQSWVFGAVPWTPCHDKPEGNLCSPL